MNPKLHVPGVSSGAGPVGQGGRGDEMPEGRIPLGLEVFIHVDFQGAEELRVLRGQPELGIGPPFGVQFLAMHQVNLATLVEADGNFENQEEVIAGVADARHDLGDSFGIGQGLVNGVAQFLDQAFEILVELQGSPGRSRLAYKHHSRIGRERLSR